VEWIQKHHPYWEMSQGRDHIFTFTHDIGGCVAPFRALKNAIFM
jgi:pterin-4a-carbinolamine dehydratase